MAKPRREKETVPEPQWQPLFDWISQFYVEPLKEIKVKELARKVLWTKLEIKFRIDINKDLFTYANSLRLSTGGSARSSSSNESTGSVPDHIRDIVDRSINFSAAEKPAAAARASAIDLCSSSDDSGNETTILPTCVAPKKSNDRRDTADTSKTSNSLGSFVGKVGKTILEALKCNSSTKRRPDRVPTTIARQETGARNVNMKKAREDSDDGDKKPAANTDNPDTDASVAVMTVAAEEAGGDPSMLPEGVDFDMEKKFAYQDDEGNTPSPPPQDNVGTVSKLSAPPKDLVCMDIDALVAGMKGLDLEMPCVNKDHLSHPEGSDASKQRSIRAAQAQGKQYHDDSLYLSMGYSPEDAKRLAWLEDWNVRLGSPFTILRDDDKGELIGVQCKSCEIFLQNLLSCNLSSIIDCMKNHYYGDCKKKCPSCGLTSTTLDNDHKKWRYEEFYRKRLCEGEEPLDFEAFIAAAKQFEDIPGEHFFFPDANHLFRQHVRHDSRFTKPDCALWHEQATWFKDYIEEYGTDVIKKENYATFGKTDKEIGQMKHWVNRNYLPNEYGSFGKSRPNAFTGNRHAIVQSIRELALQKKRKGTKPLTSFFSKK